MMFVDLYQDEKAETLIDVDSQCCKVHFARRHDPGYTHNIRRCILDSAKSRSAEWRRRNGEEQDRETVKRRRIKKKRDTETRVDRRIEATAFSRTVNQVLTGDQIGRLVLSARKDGASGALLFVGWCRVSSFFAYFYCYPWRLGASSRYFDCPPLIISLREDCVLLEQRAAGRREIDRFL